jgi:hypothetical protein
MARRHDFHADVEDVAAGRAAGVSEPFGEISEAFAQRADVEGERRG